MTRSSDATTSMAVSATLHCLTGCAIGEVLGLVLATAFGIASAPSIALSIALSFVFGYTLSSLPLLDSGLSARTALKIVLAADTLSILTMEVVDNAVVTVFPSAMTAGLGDGVFWLSTMLSLVVAFVAAVPVNRYLLTRGKGHALSHEYMQNDTTHRLPFPIPATATLATGVGMFLLGGLLVAVAG